MKLSIILMTITLATFAAGGYSQSGNFTFQLNNATLLELFDVIENESNMRVAYDISSLDIQQKISLDVENSTIDEVLSEALKDSKLTFQILGNYIVIKKSLSPEKQQATITGTVTNSNGEPVIGATVMVKGTTNGTITDVDGKYILSNVKEGDIIRFSFIGMITEEVAFSNQKSIDITLDDDIETLDEIVVVGYGSTKKSDLTGSVAQVKSKDLVSFPTSDIAQAMQGRAAGVQIQQVNGAPGSSFNVRIRGIGSIGSSTSPLYVVDGFPGANLPSPEDIASIEILKDASATAIYGSRGANGVVMITTHRGKKGKPQVELKSSFSLDKEINRIDLLDKDQFIDYVSEVNPAALSGSNTDVATDWQDEIFRLGAKQDYKLSFSGGNDELKYYVSASMYDQKGVIINSRFKRYSITSNLDIQANKKLKLGVNLFAFRTNNDGIRTQESSGGTYDAGVISSALTFEPTLPVYDKNGSYTISNIGDPTDNPVAIAKERLTEVVEDRSQVNMFGEYNIIPALKFRATLGANIQDQRWGYYVPTALRLGKDIGGQAGIGGVRSTHLINENYLTYDKTIGNSNITAMAGYSYESYHRETNGAYGQGFLTDASLWWNLDGASTYNQPNSNLTETGLQSYYGRLNYKFLNKYLITLNGRYDGSSVLAEGHKWIFFPSGAFAWNLMEESFMENITKLSQLKFRVSYGIAGSQSIAPYQSLATFQTVHSVQNSKIVNAVRPISVANKNLRWEEIAQTDIGIDLGLFENRISFTTDYFIKESSNLLFEMPLPEYSGYRSMLTNIGGVENKGVEFTLSTVNMQGKFRWVTDFNLSTYKNKVLELPEKEDIHPSVVPGHMVGLEDVNLIRVGEPTAVFYGYVYDGVIQEGEDILPGNFDQYAGGEKYKDINGRDEEGNLTGKPDGKIDGDDRTIIGNPHPDFIWGMNNTFTFKDFDLNIFIQGTHGNEIYSFTLQELETLNGSSNTTTEALNRWSTENTNTDVPIASSLRSYHSSSRWVFDGSYVRIKTIALGYNVPSKLVNSIGIEKARVSISAQNLFTITSYRGYDPEVNYNGLNSSTRLGFDYGSYPNAKSFTVGLNVTF